MRALMFQVPGSRFRVRVPVQVQAARFIVRGSANLGSVFGTSNIEPRTANSNLNTNVEPGTRHLERHAS
jgi:hypothetical protein